MSTTSWFVMAVVLTTPIGCSSNPNVRVRRLENGRLQVDGPLAGPFKTTEELALAGCELMTGQGGASSGPLGSEYCALNYYAPGEDAFYLSYLSDFKERQDSREAKTCSMPQVLNDPARRNALITGGDHTHPHNARFSPGDLSGKWSPTRLVAEGTGRVFHRELFVFNRRGSAPCTVYSFNYATRVVSALRSGQWIQIGQVYDDNGNIRMLEGMGWDLQ
ncbi:hypothetical protein LXT21_42455 [Myxococcus sp. K38C18041901]|uniref:hypothetical protein n=1 Tax=Myxococcus guangdongensis TaxID=2906760 RepID=UPI0020A706CB|nr:hypothetical protein [Myxococcus guangdongensis]MCP3065446.1 hypothetical protein [Myxococcus guangdongensis]